jgi:hypothetical protein
MQRAHSKAVILCTSAAAVLVGCAHTAPASQPAFAKLRAKPPSAARVEGADYTPAEVRGATFGNPPGTGVRAGAVRAVRPSQGTFGAFPAETADADP